MPEPISIIICILSVLRKVKTRQSNYLFEISEFDFEKTKSECQQLPLIIPSETTQYISILIFAPEISKIFIFNLAKNAGILTSFYFSHCQKIQSLFRYSLPRNHP